MVLLALGLIWLSLAIDGLDYILRTIRRAYVLTKIYGAAGLALAAFGNRSIWCLEAHVIGRLDDEEAIAFKESVQGQCSMISAAIIAQIAITGTALSYLSQTHWFVRGLLNFSLISALMSVYYATAQYRSLGRLLRPDQIRMWIRGGLHDYEGKGRIIPPLKHYFWFFQQIYLGLLLIYKEEAAQYKRNLDTSPWKFKHLAIRIRDGIFWAFVFGIPMPDDLWEPCEPDAFTVDILDGTEPERLPSKLLVSCFRPDVSAVITMSAPQALLSTSLFALLSSLCVYLGFVWAHDLDPETSHEHDSRNVFVVYIISLSICLVIYTLSMLIQDDDKRSEDVILNQYMVDWLQNPRNRIVVDQWSYRFKVENTRITFYRPGDSPHSASVHSEVAASAEEVAMREDNGSIHATEDKRVRNTVHDASEVGKDVHGVSQAPLEQMTHLQRPRLHSTDDIV